MESVNIHEAKTHFSKLLLRVHNGEEIIIAKSGTPYAKLVPFESVKQRKPGLAKGKVTGSFFESLPEDELEMWE